MAQQDLAPRVSVFMASYNAPQFVGQACQSILDQTFRDLELVVVDDGSREETRAVLRALAGTDKRMRLVEAEHGGQIETLNRALALCRGEYVARLDHDDVAYPQRIERQVAYLDAHPDVVAVGARFGKIDANGARKPKTYSWHETRRTDLSSCPPKLVFLMGPTLMARAGAMHSIGGFRHEFAAGEDKDISWRLAALGPTVSLPEVLVDHRDHAGNLGLTQSEKQAFAGFLSDLSAIAARYGKDESEALALLRDGRRMEATRAYERLLADVYPVRSLVLLNLAKPRFLKLGLEPAPSGLCKAMIAQVLAHPWSALTLELLGRIPRVAAYGLRHARP